MKGFKTLNVPEFRDYNLEDPETFIKELKGIIEFPELKEKIFLFLPGSFWKKITEVLIEPSSDNIYYLFKLRENMKENYKKENIFYSNANDTDQKDELGTSLHKMIEKNIKEEKEITSDEIIKQISEFDPYYKEEIYIDRREVNFIDKINFDEKETEWIDEFKKAKFENIFKNYIKKYIQKLISKINKMEDLGIVISLMNENEIKELDTMDYLLRELKKKAFYWIKISHTMKETKKNKYNSALASLFTLFYRNTQKLEKIKDIIDKLDNKNKHLIFLELLKSFNDDEQMKKYIFNFYINNLNIYYKNIIELFHILNEENIKNFMVKISDQKDVKNYRIISYENFFTEKENMNLNLLQELKKEIKLIENTGYYGKTLDILKNIYSKINKDLEITYLISFLKFPEENAVKRLELLNILPNVRINPKEKYDQLKNDYEKAQKEIGELKGVCQALKVFHREFHKEEINDIEEIIKKFNNGKISEFYNIDLKITELGDEIKKKVEKINKIKDSSIFKKILQKAQGSNEELRWETALKKLEPEFMAMRRQIQTVDDKSKKEFQIIIDFLGLKDDEQTKKDLKYIEDSSGAEGDITSMIFFCDNFKLNDNDRNKNEIKNKPDLEDLLREVYTNIKSNNSKKENLNKLKNENIYNCEKKGIDIEFFNLFNNQKEAIDFLLTKTHENLEIIKDKIISIDNAVKASDIVEVDDCIDFFNNILRNCKDNYELFEKIKKIEKNLLDKFKNFIRIFPSLVELDNNSDNSYILYIQANKYFREAKYYISLNYEEKYSYIEKNEEKQVELDEIKSIKRKINISNEVKLRLEDNKDLPEGQERASLEKTKLLLKFKEVINNIDLIEQFIEVFQTKGCSLPIEIEIRIKYPEVEYFLKKKKYPLFSDLSTYLLNVKNYLEKSLDTLYKSEQNLRFLYGKQFDTFNKHISGSEDIPSFLRYILNNLNDDIVIKEGKKSFPNSTKNYIDYYNIYSDDWFKAYDEYISSVFLENGTSIEDLYKRMEIKSDEGETYKGIYLYKSDYNSMEEAIIKIFIEKTRNFPIAQNILISNKETSYEEIQAFFHRAFLCRFNTLFAIEINDSLSDNNDRY